LHLKLVELDGVFNLLPQCSRIRRQENRILKLLHHQSMGCPSNPIDLSVGLGRRASEALQFGTGARPCKLAR
jgi:hypothetical protein